MGTWKMESEFKITQRNLWVALLCTGAIATAVVLMKVYAVEKRIPEPVMGDGKKLRGRVRGLKSQ